MKEIQGWRWQSPGSWTSGHRNCSHDVCADASEFEVRADEGSGYNSYSTVVRLPLELVVALLEEQGYVVTKA